MPHTGRTLPHIGLVLIHVGFILPHIGLILIHIGLLQTAVDREAELERLRAARDRTAKDEEQAWEADKDFEDFKQRVEARHAAIEESLPNMVKQKHELEDVIKRLHKANKHMNNRLSQCR